MSACCFTGVGLLSSRWYVWRQKWTRGRKEASVWEKEERTQVSFFRSVRRREVQKMPRKRKRVSVSLHAVRPRRFLPLLRLSDLRFPQDLSYGLSCFLFFPYFYLKKPRTIWHALPFTQALFLFLFSDSPCQERPANKAETFRCTYTSILRYPGPLRWSSRSLASSASLRNTSPVFSSVQMFHTSTRKTCLYSPDTFKNNQKKQEKRAGDAR